MRYENRLSQRYHVLQRRNIGCRPNLHRDLELVYVCRGRCLLHTGGRAWPMGAGCLALLFPNQVHFFEDQGENDCYLLVCSPDEFPEYQGVFQNQMPEVPVADCAGAELPALFRRLLELAQEVKGDGDPFRRGRLRGYALALLSTALPLFPMTAVGTGASTVRRLLDYCDANYMQPITLEQAARALGLSPYRICHICEERLHVSFHRFLCALRLERAKDLLSSTGDTVTQIGYGVGFGSLRAFNRQFRAYTGMTPTDYRVQCSRR